MTTKKQTREEIEKAKVYICLKCGNADFKVIKKLKEHVAQTRKDVLEEVKERLNLSLRTNLDEDISWKKKGYLNVEVILDIFDQLQSLNEK